ncbi:hypothetical protein ZWY2020_058152 [Hordeum vulgare]|nr:hypothetical protein ZWY2020_058152 [Hordeum vulgare]
MDTVHGRRPSLRERTPLLLLYAAVAPTSGRAIRVHAPPSGRAAPRPLLRSSPTVLACVLAVLSCSLLAPASATAIACHCLLLLRLPASLLFALLASRCCPAAAASADCCCRRPLLVVASAAYRCC